MQVNLEQSKENRLNRVLVMLRDSLQWSDEIPEEPVIGGGRYKVRANWFQGVISGVQFVAKIAEKYSITEGGAERIFLEAEELGSAIRKKMQEALVTTGDPFVKRTREEIDEGNRLAQEAIALCEQLLGNSI